jgi:hypothetical protein
MTIATFPKELFAIPEFRFDRSSALFVDESNVIADADARNLEGSARSFATARRIFRVAKSRYGWSDRKIEDLLCKFHEDSSFDALDSIARTLIFAEASHHLAWLAEKSSDFSFWLNLTPEQREVLFASASQLRDELPKISQLSLRDFIDLLKRSFLFNVDFTWFFWDCIDNHRKVVDNADRMETIFEKSKTPQPRVLNFSKMTQAERDLAIEHYKNIRQANIARLTPEEIEKSNKQFELAFQQIDESRNSYR